VERSAYRLNDSEDIRISLVDPNHFSVIFERHVADVSRFLTRRVKPGDVEDLVAETFIAAFRARYSYDQSRPNSLPWLYGVATNIVRHHIRGEARQGRVLSKWKERRRRDLESLDGGLLDANARIDVQSISNQLVRALDTLDPGSREALLLFACEDLSYGEIAEALRIPVGTVRSRVSRARMRLRELMDPFGATTD
jgi:RNA polymerase sigma-70 factor (ECF subfamily)